MGVKEITMTLDKTYQGVSLSQGTMLERDLVPTFLRFLSKIEGKEILSYVEQLSLENKAALLCWLVGVDVDLATPQAQDEMSWFLWEVLVEALNDIAPEGCYFGSHPGDGADYGFWPNEDLWEEEE